MKNKKQTKPATPDIEFCKAMMIRCLGAPIPPKVSDVKAEFTRRRMMGVKPLLPNS